VEGGEEKSRNPSHPKPIYPEPSEEEDSSMKRNLALTIVVILAVALAACGQAAPTTAPEAGPRTFKIGVANFSQCCPYFIGMNNAVLAEASAYSNITVVTTDANGDAAKFQSDIEDLIAQGIDGIIISGAWLEQAPAALDALAAAGIPSVLVDRQFGGGGGTGWVGRASSSNCAAARPTTRSGSTAAMGCSASWRPFRGLPWSPPRIGAAGALTAAWP
jgi:hypothetical protein